MADVEPTRPDSSAPSFLTQLEPTSRDELIAVLESKASALEDKLNEERFLWVVICVVLADAFIFTHITNWAGALVIGLLELVGIVVFADRCGVNTVRPLIDRLTGFSHRAAGVRDADE